MDYEHDSTLPAGAAKVAAAIRGLLEERDDVLAAYLFGSVARGDTSNDSDTDVAVWFNTPLDPMERFAFQERLASRLHSDVDLVDLRAASTVLQAQVLRDATLLLDQDPTARARLEMQALSMYARLNEERAGILADIAGRGSVYG